MHNFIVITKQGENYQMTSIKLHCAIPVYNLQRYNNCKLAHYDLYTPNSTTLLLSCPATFLHHSHRHRNFAIIFLLPVSAVNLSTLSSLNLPHTHCHSLCYFSVWSIFHVPMPVLQQTPILDFPPLSSYLLHFPFISEHIECTVCKQR